MASRLMLSLCGSDEARWQAAEQAAVKSLESRLDLWDGMYAAVQCQKNPGFGLDRAATVAKQPRRK